MLVTNFDYKLPKDLIAQSPAKPRDSSRLMIIDRKNGKMESLRFKEIERYLSSNDVLVLNKTKVFPARIFANKVTGGKIEILFIEEVKPGIWTALTHPGLKIGTNIVLKKYLFTSIGHKGMTVIIDTHLEKHKLMDLLIKYGHTPLPPYINSLEKESLLRKEYQTIYAKEIGSVAAPTAGFHFTETLLDKLRRKGVKIEYVTLHVGLGTFAPVKAREIENHPMHFEEFLVDGNTLERLNRAKKSGKRIISVGTTTTRVLETISNSSGILKNDHSDQTDIFIYPPYKFKFVDALITNFHLPKSTLLALVSAFVSFPNTNSKFKNFNSCLMGGAYKKAIKDKYRFYSFGDVCFII